MAAVAQLGYLGISVKDVESWRGYATGLLGLDEVGRDGDGTVLLGMDSHHNRIQLSESGADDIAYVGWQVDSADDLSVIAARLDASGIPTAHGPRELAERRRVADLITFDDPDGNQVEVFTDPEMAAAPRESRFQADDLGLGHLVLYVDNLERTMDFYTGLLGFKVSDYVDTGFKLGFLHCNPRHHSIAFGEYAKAKQRIHHFMLQTREIDPVGRAYDEAKAGAAKLVTTLGRHSNDEMVSFYMRNPSGFAVEYGWGAREIDDCAWTVEHYTTGSLWGHKPVRSAPVEAAAAAAG